MDNPLGAEQQVPFGVLTGINFSVLNDTEAEKVSVLSIESANEVTDPRLGMPNPTSQCPTCGAKDSRSCEGHFGVIKFPFTILHPYFIAETAQVLNRICPGCKSVKHIKVKGAVSKQSCRYCNGSFRESYPKMIFKVSSDDVFGKTAIIVEVVEKVLRNSPNKSSGENLAADYWDIIPRDVQLDESSMKPTKRVLSHAQVYHMLKDVDPQFIKESAIFKKNPLFLNCFLVTPNSHRVAEFGQHVVFDDRTRILKKMVDFRGTANELSSRVLDGLKSTKIRAEKPSTPEYGSSGNSTSGLRHIKELLLGKRSDHAFRMVIVGDPNIKLSEIGVPCHIAERLQISEHLNSWNWEKLNTCSNLRILERGEIYVRRKDQLVAVNNMGKLQIGDLVHRPLNDGDVVLINRPPSIHQHSFIALSVKVLPVNSVLSINPLVCSPFRGDFDGDCIHGYVPQSIDSRAELQELVALDKQLINGQSGRNLLSLGQDSLTAAHLVVEDGVLLSLRQMQQLQMFCPNQLQFPAIAKASFTKATSPDNFFWSGKQLFSLLLPPDFDYVFPENDVHISKGELLSSSDMSNWLRDADGNLIHGLVKHCQEKSIDFLHAAQNVLCEWLSMRGLSVSLSDLYLSSDSSSRKNMIGEVSYGLQEAERISHIKLLMVDSHQDFLIGTEEGLDSVDFGAEHMCCEKQKSAALSRVFASAFKQVFWDIQNLVYQYASKENSLLAMLKAGSKGNLLRLVQHSMCLGLQHSLVPLAFRLPHELSCAAWIDHKASASTDIPECSGRYIPSATIGSSYLSGLNPLECFVHSVTARDISFSDNADLPGTLNRRLMFFMRDLYIGYDGTVRNAYGNQLIQFSYGIDDTASSSKATDGSLRDSTYDRRAMGCQPVGSLAACAISEAAYSALDQPISALESSPLLNLKKVLECGVKKKSGDKTASLYLSKKLGRWTHGFEYAALEVQSHLERLLFSDIVSTSMIVFSEKACSRKHTCPWVCHFHISKEMTKRRRIKVQSIIDALDMNWKCASARSKTDLPKLQIKRVNCSVADMQKENSATFCIAVKVVKCSKNPAVEIDNIRDMVIPFLLGTVVKGFLEFKKVDILWKDGPKMSRSHRSSSGELYLRVFMSENCERRRFWSAIKENCLEIMEIIDWERSHPDDIHDLTLAFGIDVARKHFLITLMSAISDIGKPTLPEHLLLTADCLSATGEFVALNVKGLAEQRKRTSVSSPFMQACFANPADCLIKAAKKGVTDDLQGSVDALSWGKTPSIGTGGTFDIIYSGKGQELSKPEDIYKLLGSHLSSREQNVKVNVPGEHDFIFDKCIPRPLCTSGEIFLKGRKNLEISKLILRKFITLKDILRLSQALKYMLHNYPINRRLSEVDKSIAMMALYFHPRRNEKMGTGAREIKIGYHSEHDKARCFTLVRTDGTVEDFSYHKCIHHALEEIAPQRAKPYQMKWLSERIPKAVD
ncbi:DNA-directed RNA polymerase IV subunit 1 isoform X2 [Rhododendron vialii]|uniref:DNA-directed RNA polymerase IV subunit 1 isoform X2 n=1 Tax=Rhododendron vialii TaxID=182163 RepID=UPI00265E8037|nr:DNA-directed RNA polymerase IV subunit 1 isoform X2 [Rhododendron vialii]